MTDGKIEYMLFGAENQLEIYYAMAVKNNLYNAMKFQSSLREVMLFIKYSKDRKNLSRILKNNEKRFRELERRAADVIEAMTPIGLKYDKNKEAVDICQAIQEMRMKSEQKKSMEIDGKLHEMGLNTEKIAQTVGYAVEIVKE